MAFSNYSTVLLPLFPLGRRMQMRAPGKNSKYTFPVRKAIRVLKVAYKMYMELNTPEPLSGRWISFFSFFFFSPVTVVVFNNFSFLHIVCDDGGS